MERETGFEPATASLGIVQSIGNKEHCVSGISFWRYRIACFRPVPPRGSDRSTNGAHKCHSYCHLKRIVPWIKHDHAEVTKIIHVARDECEAVFQSSRRNLSICRIERQAKALALSF